ncbi:MAG: hypothetical protein JWO22_1414 [Frankiales bacterium]|nr:hypothetical protein [Frankiales bacterium]
MLYALRYPPSLLVLLSSYVIGLTLHGWVQALVAERLGDHSVRHQNRLQFNPRWHIDPFGAVAGLIGGLGWAAPVELPGRRDRRRAILVALSGPAVNILLGVGLLLLWRATQTGASTLLASVFASSDGGAAYFLQRGVPFTQDALGLSILLAGASQLYLGVLSLVPIPPLDGGRLLFALCPQTLGWQRARHYLVEQNIGVAVLLALLLITLGGGRLLAQLLDTVLAPLMKVLLGV